MSNFHPLEVVDRCGETQSGSDSDLFIRHYNKQKYNLFNM